MQTSDRLIRNKEGEGDTRMTLNSLSLYRDVSVSSTVNKANDVMGIPDAPLVTENYSSEHLKCSMGMALMTSNSLSIEDDSLNSVSKTITKLSWMLGWKRVTSFGTLPSSSSTLTLFPFHSRPLSASSPCSVRTRRPKGWAVTGLAS